MTEYKPESAYRCAQDLTFGQLEEAARTGEILQSTALAFDQSRRLRILAGGQMVMMEPSECAEGLAEGETRPIAVLSRVGRPVCFMVQSGPQGGLVVSRRAAQQRCRTEYLDLLQPGDVVPCEVNHIEPFGAFCDVGCGISALLPIDCLSVSRIQSPADRVDVGQTLFCAVKSRDDQGRLVLTLRELLGTWQQNAQQFSAGDTVVGVVRSIEPYGVFIEIAPNLAGLAEPAGNLSLGQTVSVFIKNILPDRMKIKLVVVNQNLPQPMRFPLMYQQTSGHISRWDYSTPESGKEIATVFDSHPLTSPCV